MDSYANADDQTSCASDFAAQTVLFLLMRIRCCVLLHVRAVCHPPPRPAPGFMPDYYLSYENAGKQKRAAALGAEGMRAYDS